MSHVTLSMPPFFYPPLTPLSTRHDAADVTSAAGELKEEVEEKEEEEEEKDEGGGAFEAVAALPAHRFDSGMCLCRYICWEGGRGS